MYLRLEKPDGSFFLMNMDHVVRIEAKGKEGKDAVRSLIYHFPTAMTPEGKPLLSVTEVAVPLDRIRAQVADIWENDSH